jgi:hypothetical protein
MSIDAESGPARGTPFVNTSGGREINVKDEAQAAKVVDEILEHRRRGLGKLVGLAGLPRHGKTEFAKQARDNRKFGQEEIREYAQQKTYGGMVNVYFLPGEQRRDVLIDLAGEDFQDFGRYSSGIPDVMQRILWPALPRLDGLVMFVALPLLWDAWNHPDGTGGALDPTVQQVRITEETTAEMINSTTLLLKYAMVARQLGRVRKTHPNLKLTKPEGHSGLWAPDRHTIDEAFKAVGALDIPVFIAFSKADLCETVIHPTGLRTPPLPANAKAQYHARIQPELSDPLVLGMQAFPRLHEFLSKHVRYFKYDFVQVIRDASQLPSADHAPLLGQGGVADLRGVESALEFVADHPWGIGSPGTVKAVEWSRRTDPDRWTRGGMQKALGQTWAATMPTFAYMSAPPASPPPPLTESVPARVISLPPIPDQDVAPEASSAAPPAAVSALVRKEPVSSPDPWTRSDDAERARDPNDEGDDEFAPYDDEFERYDRDL